MNYTEKVLWQTVDGDSTEEQRSKFVEDCRDDPALLARYNYTQHIHEMLKSTISKAKMSDESFGNQQDVSSRQNQNRQN